MSLPADDPSRKKLGAFLVNTQFQGSVNSSAMFLTAAAQNLLCLKIATEMGVIIPSAWVTWFKAAVVPAFISLALTPMIMYKIFPPEIKSTPEAPALAAKRLESMGPMSRNEKIMLGTMATAVLLWVCGDAIGVSAVTTAMIGLSALLFSGVLTWRECLTYPAAWDTLFWFAILVGMSGQLNSLGVISHFANQVGAQLVAANMGWPQVFVLLNGAYFVLHYMFASQVRCCVRMCPFCSLACGIVNLVYEKMNADCTCWCSVFSLLGNVSIHWRPRCSCCFVLGCHV